MSGATNRGHHDFVCTGLVWTCEPEPSTSGPCWPPLPRPQIICRYRPVPLTSVSVKASVVHAVAQVEVTQVYVNREPQPIEAIYYFPTNPDGAVTHFQAELEGKIIKGKVKPKEEAKTEYNNAVRSGTTAFLGEETNPDVFKLQVGYLQPGSQVKVMIGYVTEVRNEPGSSAIHFYLPTTIAPRIRYEYSDSGGRNVQGVPHSYSSSSPAPLTINATISLQGGIKSIQSPSHMVKISKLPMVQGWHKALVELSGQVTAMDRDFVLKIVPHEIHKPGLLSETDPETGTTAVMLHLLPSFKLDDQKTELFFLLDRSGSMQGQRIELAKKALLVFLHSMPPDCYFNVIGFGSYFQSLYPHSVKYDNRSLKHAVTSASDMHANMGGTEILRPLQEIYNQPGVDGYLRQIFLLTDGEVSNTEAILSIAQVNAHNARVFALGIGEDASHLLVEGVARAGGGTSAFVASAEGIDKKVINQLKNGLQPSLTDIQVEWEGLTNPSNDIPDNSAPKVLENPIPVVVKPDPKPVIINKEKTLVGYNKPIEPEADEDVEIIFDGATVAWEEIQWKKKQSPKKIPPVHDGCQMVVFGMFKNDCPKSVSIKAESPDGPLTIKVELSPDCNIGSTTMLHRLSAIKLVRELELDISALQFQNLTDPASEEEKMKREIIHLACKNGIASRYTSFIAVDPNNDKPFLQNWTVMETRHVPNQIPHGSQTQNSNFMQFQSTPFSFGQAPQQISAPTGCFGSSMGTSSFASGNPNATNFSFTNPTPQFQFQNSVFGGISGSAGFSFGTGVPQGATAASTPTLFGSASAHQGLGTPAPVFASHPTTTSRSLFGVSSTQQSTGAPAPLFGSSSSSQSAPTTSGSFFGAPSVNQSAPPQTSVFGSSVMHQNVTPSVFGTVPSQMFQQQQSSVTGGADLIFGTSSGPTLNEPSQNENHKTLMKLIKLQSFDGSYNLDQELADVMERSLNNLKYGAITSDQPEKVFATALAVGMFITKLADESEVWELVVAKAKKWLASAVQAAQIDVNELVQLAATFLTS